MKREGVSTLFICSYLWALSYLLDHLLLFENVLVVWVSKVFWKRAFVMVLVSIRTCTKCCFENSSKRCLWNVFLKVILKRIFFVMALISIRTRIKCCFENSSKRCFWNVFFESDFEKGIFVMALVSIRTHTKCCLLKMFQNVPVVWVLKVFWKTCLCNGSRLYKNVYKVLFWK